MTKKREDKEKQSKYIRKNIVHIAFFSLHRRLYEVMDMFRSSIVVPRKKAWTQKKVLGPILYSLSCS